MPAEGDWASATQPGEKPLLNSIFQCSAEFLGELKLWFDQNGTVQKHGRTHSSADPIPDPTVTLSTGHSLTVKNSLGVSIFRVDEDGTVHIKTATAVLADL